MDKTSAVASCRLPRRPEAAAPELMPVASPPTESGARALQREAGLTPTPERQHAAWWRSAAWLTLLFGAEVVALNVLELPLSLDFTHFFFGDQGANLTIQYLVAHGYRPNVDFGYHYGLLPILFGRIWFALVGATPVGYQAAMVVAGLLMAWALARLAANLQIAPVGLLFLFCAMPFAIMSSYVNLAHALEAVLLCNALAEQAAGRYPSVTYRKLR